MVSEMILSHTPVVLLKHCLYQTNKSHSHIFAYQSTSAYIPTKTHEKLSLFFIRLHRTKFSCRTSTNLFQHSTLRTTHHVLRHHWTISGTPHHFALHRHGLCIYPPLRPRRPQHLHTLCCCPRQRPPTSWTSSSRRTTQ